ncbi:uncharacterized protein LOC134670712 [Cydia fagiglandana]|uniref:uncharacterized protein LOC134670712 n=1 Tax=Cydia fagiglandana TaxID=1458189 RepID=UPI002FEE3216
MTCSIQRTPCGCLEWLMPCTKINNEQTPLLSQQEPLAELLPEQPPEQRCSLSDHRLRLQLRLYRALLLPEEPRQPLDPSELLAAQQRWRAAVKAAQERCFK